MRYLNSRIQSCYCAPLIWGFAPEGALPLRALSLRLGEVQSREALCKSVGGDLNERAIDVQVTRLRRKIEPDPGFPRYLRTVRGQGYRLVDA